MLAVSGGGQCHPRAKRFVVTVRMRNFCRREAVRHASDAVEVPASRLAVFERAGPQGEDAAA